MRCQVIRLVLVVGVATAAAFENATEEEPLKYPIREYMNLSVNPCDDFYEYACGGWHELSEFNNESALTSVVNEVNFKVRWRLKEILESEADWNDTFTTGQKAKVIYDSCMNAECIRMRGLQPFFDLTDTLGGWPVLSGSDWNREKFDWVELVAEIKLLGKSELLGFIVDAHPDELLVPVLRFFPVLYDASFEPTAILEEKLLMDVLNLTDTPEERKVDSYKAIMVFRDDLVELADYIFNITYTEKDLKLTIRELGFLAPDFDWIKYFTTIQGEPLNINQEVFIGTLDIYYIHLLMKIVDRTPPETVANFLFWRLLVDLLELFDISSNFDYTETDEVDAKFGQWSRCIKQIEHVIGDVVSGLYVREHLTPEIERDVREVIGNLSDAYKDILGNVSWTNETTKRMVLEKLDGIQYDVGYPKDLLSFTDLDVEFANVVVDRDQYFENMIQIMRVSNRNKNICNLRYFLEWPEQPTVVNAYYLSHYNRVAVPVAILRPPYFHQTYPPSVIYSGVGEIISHEIMHAFDTNNRYMSVDNGTIGGLWHDNSTTTPFDAACFERMFQNFEFHGSDIDWTFFQEEIVSDLVSIQAAFKAFSKVLADANEEDHTSFGKFNAEINITQEQEFFLNFAQNRCQRVTPEMLDTMNFFPIKTRVMTALTSFEGFLTSFQCSPEHDMSSPDACPVW